MNPWEFSNEYFIKMWMGKTVEDVKVLPEEGGKSVLLTFSAGVGCTLHYTEKDIARAHDTIRKTIEHDLREII